MRAWRCCRGMLREQVAERAGLMEGNVLCRWQERPAIKMEATAADAAGWPAQSLATHHWHLGRMISGRQEEHKPQRGPQNGPSARGDDGLFVQRTGAGQGRKERC